MVNSFSHTLKYVLIFLFLGSFLYGQIKNEKQDSITQDSIIELGGRNIFKNLDENKNKNGINRFLHRVLIKRPGTKKAVSTTHRFEENRSDFHAAEGKYIRNIHIDTREPFGYSLNDSTKQPTKFIEKAGNTLHIRTKNFVIRNYLLVKEGQKFDSLKILESERLIRSQRFTRRVRIDYQVVGESSDSVDLYVNTLDSWTIIPNGSYSGSKLGVRLRDRNFMGWGHDFDNRYRHNFETGQNKFSTRYTIPNIQKTYIGFSIGYSSNEENEYTKGVSLQRTFFSPLTKWAGGIYVGQRYYQDSIPNNLNIPIQSIKFNYQDYWAGYSIPLFKKENSLSERLNNLIISARYFNMDYQDTPVANLDPAHHYSNEEFYLMGLGITRRGYVQDRFIRNYDIVEDIPVGLSYGITSGFQRKNYQDRFYLAGGVKFGNYYTLGYFGFEARYGGFIVDNKGEQTVFSISGNYFTRLLTWKNWKFRNFISSNLILGGNRVDSPGDRLTLNERDPLGIPGFRSIEVVGTKKWLTNVQIQSYSPYDFLGFRLSPFLSGSFGLIGNENLLKGKMYTKIGIGVLFTNDYLIFNNFQLSFAWYNSIPGDGTNIYKTNAFNIYDYDLMEFDFGKPQLIPYNRNGVY
jgi:hypothetical protein